MAATPHIYHYAGLHYVRLSELPAEEQAALGAWLWGQTVPVIPGVPLDDACYRYDYERWRRVRETGRDDNWD